MKGSGFMTLAQAQALLPGSVCIGDPGLAFDRVHSDSRSVQPGDCFVALPGARFDGHDHLAAARAAGAVAALASHGLAAAGLPGLQVADTLAALQQLAAGWRAQWSAAGPLVAVTGSNGKTTVTQMLAAIFKAWHGDAALATAGNFNNHIGLPLTLLRLRSQHRAAVVELGMNHPGEIALLAALAAPTVALVNNAQREHQEFMASVEAVALENGAVLQALPEHGVAVLPAGDIHEDLWRAQLAERGQRRRLSFGLQAGDPASHVQAVASWHADAAHWQLQLYTPVGAADTTLALAGRHNVLNAAAATACALAAGAPLVAVALGLARFEAVRGRSQTRRLQRLDVAAQAGATPTFTLVDDSYNANPDSVLAAIAVLHSLPGPRWLLLGDMGEVGSQGAAFHAEVGAAARAAGIEHFWSAGTLSSHCGAARHFDTSAAMALAIQQGRGPQDAAAVLVKGSRFMQMEQVVQAIAQGAVDAA